MAPVAGGRPTAGPPFPGCAAILAGMKNPALTVALALFFTSASFAQTPRSVRFTKIADTNTAVPGGTGTFAVFADARALDSEHVVFFGIDGASKDGLYTFPVRRGGTLDVLVNESTFLPDIGGTIGTIFDVSIDAGTVAFAAGWGSGPSPCFSAEEGVFVASVDGSSIQLSTSSLSSSLACFHGVDLEGSTLRLTGGTAGVDAVHNHQAALLDAAPLGSPIVLLDTSSTFPGGVGTYDGFDQDVVLKNGATAFTNVILNTFGAVDSIFLDTGSSVQTVADPSTPIPGDTGTFASFAGIDFDGTEVAFMGRNATNNSAIFAGTNPSDLRVVANRNTNVPGTPFTFLGLSNPVARGNGITAFSGFWSGGGYGLFYEVDGHIEKLVAKGDVLGGLVVEQAFCHNGGISGNKILFRVIFQGFTTQALYLAELRLPRRFV